jgi:transglutaminase-like putative cysteine protease
MTKKSPDGKGKDDWTKEDKSGKSPAAKKEGASAAKNSRAGLSTAADADASSQFKPPENSIGVRIVALGMALVCVGVSIVFIPAPPMMALAYIVALITGNYMSFVNRHGKTFWQSKVVFGGIALVGVNCWLELNSGIELGDFSAFAPGIHFLAGTYVMQSFELRTRTEINTSMMLGLLILALIAPLSKSIIFGGAIFTYLCLLAALLYFDCIKNTAQNARKEQINEVSLTPVTAKKNIFFKGNAVMCLSVIPVVSIMMFLLLPRADNFIDNLYAYISSLNGKKADSPVMMPEVLPQSAKRWSPPDRKKGGKSLISSNKSDKSKKSTSGDEKSDATDSKASNEADDKDSTGTDTQKAKGEAAKTAQEKNAKGKSKSANAKTGKDKGGTAASEKGGKKGGEANADSSDALGYDDEMDVSQPAATSDAIVMKVRSNRTCYMKMYGFDHYDESGKWTSTVTDATELDRPARGGIDLSKLPALMVSPNFPAVQLTQECQIEHDLSRDIPAAWIPSNIDLKTNSITVDEMGSLRLTNDEELKKGKKYKVTSSFPVYDVAKMRTAPALEHTAEDDIRFKLSRYLQLPKECPDTLISEADSLTAGNNNWFEKTEKIADYLRHTYKYSYNKHHEDSTDPLRTFFSEDSEKVGDCKDFATALVLMDRAVGIPARLVCGFSPGELNSITGYHEVKVKNWHSWAEVYVPDSGWVPFDATPAGYLPDKPKEKSYDLDSLQHQKNQELEQLAQPKEEQKEHKPPITWQQVVGLLSAALVIGACLFFLIRMIIKAIKKARENAPGRHPAKKILKKVETALKRWKVIRLPHETGPEFSRKVKLAARERTKSGQAIDKDFNSNIESFMDKYDAAYYGNKELLAELEMLSKPILDTVMKGGKVGAASGAAAASGTAAGSAVKSSSQTEAAVRPTKPGKPGS